MNVTIIKSAEEGIKHLQAHTPSGVSFQWAISESFTFAGKPDTMGAGMAVLMDKILVRGREGGRFLVLIHHLIDCVEALTRPFDRQIAQKGLYPGFSIIEVHSRLHAVELHIAPDPIAVAGFGPN